MPYRRLPNTNQARLTALKRAVQRASEADYNDQVLSYKTLSEAQRFVMKFEGQVSQYNDNYSTKVTVNKSYRKVVQNARMYISHFIQVLNMSVQRGEIKRDHKLLYGLDPDSSLLPDLQTDGALLEWGEKIINGEQKRQAQGGFPIYNPAINKVKVHYDIFREQQVTHALHNKKSTRVFEDLDALRSEADAIILDIWNQVEAHYANLFPYERMMRCKAYGVVYYYRTGEKKLSAETDRKLQEASTMQTTLQWND